MTSIRLEGISKVFGSGAAAAAAVDDVTLDVDPGEWGVQIWVPDGDGGLIVDGANFWGTLFPSGGLDLIAHRIQDDSTGGSRWAVTPQLRVDLERAFHTLICQSSANLDDPGITIEE